MGNWEDVSIGAVASYPIIVGIGLRWVNPRLDQYVRKIVRNEIETAVTPSLSEVSETMRRGLSEIASKLDDTVKAQRDISERVAYLRGLDEGRREH